MSTIQEDRENLAAAEARVQQSEVLYAWLQSNPAYRYDAAIKILQDYHNGEPWTLESLSESLERLVDKGVLKPLRSERIESDAARAAQEAADAEIKHRADLVKYILENRTMTDDTRRSESVRLSSKHTTTQTLQTIADNIKRARLSEQELKMLAKEEEQAQFKSHNIRPTQYKTLPGHLQNWRSVASLTGEEMRHAIQHYGRAQLDAVLAQRETED